MRRANTASSVLRSLTFAKSPCEVTEADMRQVFLFSKKEMYVFLKLSRQDISGGVQPWHKLARGFAFANPGH